MEVWTQVAVPLLVALLTSTALWGVVSKVILGMVYIERGYVTQDEYENLQVYLYEPYEEMGGNGSARRVMEEVRKLPIR